MKTIDLYNLEVDVEYEFIPEFIGGQDEHGNTEKLPAYVEITSVKSKNIELIDILTKEQLAVMQDELLEERTN